MTPTDISTQIDNLVAPSVAIDEMELEARHDHLRMLAHAAVGELLELVRLRDKLAERGERLGPLDCFKWIDAIEELEAARLRYVGDFRRYDGPQIIREAATNFAGPKVAQVIEGAMASWRERVMAEAQAKLERERAAERSEGPEIIRGALESPPIPFPLSSDS